MTTSTGARRLRSRRDTVIGVLMLVVMLFPIYWMLNLSVQASGSSLASSVFPTEIHLDGYRAAIDDQSRNLMTSLVVSMLSVALTLAIAVPAAYALAQFRLRGLNAILLVLAVTQMIPGIVVANSLYSAFNDLGLLNTMTGLVAANASHSIPFAILLVRTAMQAVPVGVLEAARIDGAGLFRTFRSIAVPIARNGIITASLFSFLFTWSDFLFALTLTTTDDLRPVTLGIYTYLGADQTDWAAVMATSVFASLPAIVLLLVAQRYIAAGASGGAVK
ncbi:carbohydrate ABC transporter permease [Quadrisphaera sp. INWT6]|uniref:carbohydrate ABC transporter permease n=1 Tax=Quadrisphaera sp. INWT6 TaxID=2596917 RepID=UPI00189219B7|nr:carbohydrate ABC transporter permease [Quadrisphaera sp. INWT6]MBF5082313.1 carbohydrate ABC transporter permease [Quadrisphaera sp. INWT6]